MIAKSRWSRWFAARSPRFVTSAKYVPRNSPSKCTRATLYPLHCNAARAHMIKPRLTFWQIWNMSFGFLGIQFGWGLQMANMSAIYEYLGANADQIPMLWLAAPLTGLIVQPIIGHSSDRTWGRL